ncbi:Oxidoreductase, molybdopterin-binding domain-containing protein [Jimgerdemannia flammicorona]|uniref:Oxidoreductase, molybdopterin-binding domain-containing protein n=1 Tax=Jimgerdemannia flammicorona TaxID=994334 RepID=A0A433DC73_9FUNG|nr:Oxidoreductase, molybdopterin-binding domain-containing protein [Jimgerdemannia flammicorona]
MQRCIRGCLSEPDSGHHVEQVDDGKAESRAENRWLGGVVTCDWEPSARFFSSDMIQPIFIPLLYLLSMELSYVADPSHPPSSSLIIHKDHPFNAEPPLPQLVEHYVTPEPTFFKRNHGPIPDIDKTKHRVEVKGLVATNLSLGVEELRSRFEKVDVVATLECAGNRRDHLDKVKKTKGVIWSAGAVGTAWWTGARLRDVLMAAGVPTDPRNRVQATWHVAFEGADECEEEKDKDVGKRGYGSSIPLEKAM